MMEWITAGMLLTGATFSLLAAIGLVRMPDLFTRMQASTKSGTFGVGCVMLAVAVHFGELGAATRAVLVMIFFFLTAPVAAHMLARAAYLSGVGQWEGTRVDELRGRYDPKTGTLLSKRAINGSREGPTKGS